MNLRPSRLFTAILLMLLSVIPVTAQDANDEVSLGEIVTIEGEVQEILSPYSFVMERTEPFDFTPSEVVVINDDTEPFAVDVNVGRTVQVTGEVARLHIDDIVNEIAYEIETALFGEYDTEDYTLVASLVTDPIDLPQAGDFEYDPNVLTDFELNPIPYLGDTFTVEGYVAEILGPYSFRLEETEPFDLSPSSFVVFNDDTEPFAVDINVGRHVRVTGPVYAFESETFSVDLDYDYDEEIFVDYDDGDYSMIGESVVAVSARTADTVYTTGAEPVLSSVTMDDVEDDPLAYVGQTVTVEGEVEETYTDTDFLLEEDEFFDLDPMQIPVFSSVEINDDEDLLDFIDDELYLVTGEVVPFNLMEIEGMLGFTPDPALYPDFDAYDIAIVATAINRATNE